MSHFEKFLQAPRTLRVLDAVIRNEVALVLGVLLLLVVRHWGIWDWFDQGLVLVGLPFAGATWYEYWRAKTRRYETMGEGERVIIGVFINQPVGAALVEKFGRPADLLFSTQEMNGGRAFLTPEEMHELSRQFVRAVLKYQHREIVLAVAVPQAMAFQIGQLLGAHKFRVRPLNFMAGQFGELPLMGIDDMPG